MSSDFLNFGTAALNIAGETAIIGESMKMLRGAQKTVNERKKKTVLAYPKHLFTREQVLRERNKMGYPKAYSYHEKGSNHYLILEPHLFEKHYVNHQRKTIEPSRHEKNEYGVASRPQDWEFDFRI